MSASAFGDAAELQRLIDMFTTASNAAAASGGSRDSPAPAAGQDAHDASTAAAAAGADGLALGYLVTPVNVLTGQPLAKPQTLTGTAAMAAHVLLMKIHSKALVRAPPQPGQLHDAVALLRAAGGRST